MTTTPVPLRDSQFCRVCQCGCSTWHLLMDGRIECRSCGLIHSLIRWAHIQPEKAPNE